jgi:hypothetical protein
MRHLEKHQALLFALFMQSLLPIHGLAGQDATLAASGDSTPQWHAGATHFYLGTVTLGLGALNAELARSGRPTFGNRVVTLGVATHARFGRLLYGASIEQSIPRRALEDDWILKLVAGGATLDAGLVLLESSNTLIYATVSLGMRGTSLHFERPDDFTYGEGLEDPARALDLASRTAAGGLGLTVERHFAMHRTGPFTIATAMGVTRPLGHPGTFAGESRIAQTPEQTSGGYLRIAFGKPLRARRKALGTIGAALASMILR